MDDNDIIKLYLDRDETAIKHTQSKYDSYCYSISYRILCNREDSRECVNDTYMAAWNSIPPQIPTKLPLYLAAIIRNLSVKRLRYIRAEKRDNSKDYLLSELEECIPVYSDPDKEIEAKTLSRLLDRFLRELGYEERCFFIKRYWYMYPVSEIAKEYSCTESKVKMKLKRTRDKLYKLLKKEGIEP